VTADNILNQLNLYYKLLPLWVALDKTNETGEIREWESPPITVWLPKGAYRLVGGVTSNANIVVLSNGIYKILEILRR
jgi:hypothetical protein